MIKSSLLLITISLLVSTYCFPFLQRDQWIDATNKSIKINGVDISTRVKGEITSFMMISDPSDYNTTDSVLKVKVKDSQGKINQQIVKTSKKDGPVRYQIRQIQAPSTDGKPKIKTFQKDMIDAMIQILSRYDESSIRLAKKVLGEKL